MAGKKFVHFPAKSEVILMPKLPSQETSVITSTILQGDYVDIFATFQFSTVTNYTCYLLKILNNQ